jgi:hypothetical protein
VRLEVVKPSLPIAAITVQPLVQLTERLRAELIGPSLSLDGRYYQASVTQHAEML